ncbi:Hint domain-containing protein [Cribrihabitans marinus]|uniref:Hint domain-containing protein n=1 Tax=Cribrihabitans marinus TaxID=1227549 RepID=A0A1H6V6E8_9RHOB|nr:Hint domain-containing protein [Cribrihabitans marinus]GGH26245.1 hypothetical protein GCM10010973_13910 [Cribrihabitans marinus]SEJ00101.1 Hint domain-containing protein [Cribrihabitans marinus]
MRSETAPTVVDSRPATEVAAGTGAEAGLLAGTQVLTQAGETPVERIRPGQRIITRDAGLVSVMHCRHHVRQCHAVRIAAGSLGDLRPEHDLILPAGQPVLIRDWRARAMFGRDRALVPAGALVDGEYVLDLGLREIAVAELRFDAPHVIYAGGLELSVPGRAAQPVAA